MKSIIGFSPWRLSASVRGIRYFVFILLVIIVRVINFVFPPIYVQFDGYLQYIRHYKFVLNPQKMRTM